MKPKLNVEEDKYGFSMEELEEGYKVTHSKPEDIVTDFVTKEDEDKYYDDLWNGETGGFLKRNTRYNSRI